MMAFDGARIWRKADLSLARPAMSRAVLVGGLPQIMPWCAFLAPRPDFFWTFSHDDNHCQPGRGSEPQPRALAAVGFRVCLRAAFSRRRSAADRSRHAM